MSKLLILLPIFLTSCTILPDYRVQRVERCEREYYDKICEGRNKGYDYGVKSVYDEE